MTGKPYGSQTVVDCQGEGKRRHARPVDCAEAPDGTIIWSSDEPPALYRLSRSAAVAVRVVRRVILAGVILYGSWLAMMAVHELGHVLHATASGGRVVDVSLPLAGFSQTIVHPSPHEHFVVWGGPLWGAALPVIASAGVRLFRKRVPALLRFFAGFCLVANGVYIGVGWTHHAGDAGDLLRLGTPRWVMIAFGIACVAGGLWIWHTLGRVRDLVAPAQPPAAR